MFDMNAIIAGGLKVKADPKLADRRLLQFVRESEVIKRADRNLSLGERRMVWTNVDGAISDFVRTLCRLVDPEHAAAIEKARADGRITKVQQIYLQFYLLLEVHKLDLDTMVHMLSQHHRMVPGVGDLREKLMQMGIMLGAITNGIDRFLRDALRSQAFWISVFGNRLHRDFDGSFWLELVHDADGFLDKGQILRQAFEQHAVVPWACIGDGPSDVSMAQEVNRLGGLVLTCGDCSPLTEWCKANLKDGDFIVYTPEQGFTREIVGEILKENNRSAEALERRQAALAEMRQRSQRAREVAAAAS